MSSIVSLGNHKIVARLLPNAKKIPVWKFELVKVTLDVQHKQWYPNMYVWYSVLNETKTGIYLILILKCSLCKFYPFDMRERQMSASSQD